ncbi:MAG: DNA-binding response OmpR family regulator [Rhodothermales bacterium]|jgi:DNA-binding response OmpR family regulator
MAESNTNILFVAIDPDARFGIRELLEQQEFVVHCRSSSKRAFQYLTVSDVDLVIIDQEFRDGSAPDFCRRFRVNKETQELPLIVVGEDSEDGANCIAALDAGADDFVLCPFYPGVLLARARRLLKVKQDEGGSMTVHVGAGQLPGILQYLETETRSGTLTVVCGDKAAVLSLKEGRLVNATAPLCKDMDVVTEILSWPSSDVTFIDGEVGDKNAVFNYEITGCLMNCVVEVDEFRDIQSKLPPARAMFQPGPTPGSGELNKMQMAVYEMALNGYSLEELLSSQKVTERQHTLWLNELLEKGYLIADDGPFANYKNNAYTQYEKSKSASHQVDKVRDVITEMEFPLPALPARMAFTRQDWMSTAPKLVVTGDNSEYVGMLIRCMSNISAVITGRMPRSQRNQRGAETTRLVFGEDVLLDIQQLPAVFDKATLRNLDDLMSGTVGAIFVVSRQDRSTCKDNLRSLRLLRQRFRGAYYLVVPQVLNKEGMHEFRINCSHCGYRLAVDMSLAGSEGECPICNAELTVPDPLDHLSKTLEVPTDVPVVMIKPDVERHARDLLLFLFQSISSACPPPKPEKADEPANSVVSEKDMRSSQLLAVTEIRGREMKDGEQAPKVGQTSRTAQIPKIEKPAQVADLDDTSEPPEPQPKPRKAKTLMIKRLPDTDPNAAMQRVLDDILNDSNSDSQSDNPLAALEQDDDDDGDFDIDDLMRQLSQR